MKPGRGKGAAGSDYEAIVFTNESNHPCTLYGYPGVSWVTGNQGTQVGDAFTRDARDKKPTITLKTGGSAHVTTTTANPGSFDKAKCKPVAVRGLRIYPPDETAAVFVPRPATACSAKGFGGIISAMATGTDEN